MREIKQVYIPYWKWEDYKSGMWSIVPKDKEDEMLRKAIKFTSDHKKYGRAMVEVVFKWRHTMSNSLTNPSINRFAFLGHCAVTYKLGIPEQITRKAWGFLTEQQRVLANNEAKKTIEKWRIEYLNTSKHGEIDATKKEYQMRLQLK